MKTKIAIIVIFISAFILAVVGGVIYKRSKTPPSGENHTAADLPLPPPEPEETTAGEEKADGEGEGFSEALDVVMPESPPESESEPKIPLPKFDELLAVNPYVAGWLEIDDSVIDVPVVYTPGSQNYFLHRDVEGKDNSTGTLFIAIDWEDGYNNTLIYGHNMKDGSGFGSLQKFADESYGKRHPFIHFDTLYEEKEYELYGVFYSQIEEEELETEEDREEKDKEIEEAGIEQKAEEEGVTVEMIEPKELTLADLDLNRDFGGEDIYREEKDEDNGRFRYYYYTDLSDKADFDYYAKSIKERALYDTGVEAEWGDEFITLSTCSYQVKNGRFVVVGVRKR